MGHETKGTARIMNMSEIKKTGNHRNRMVKGQKGEDYGLCYLVKYYYGTGDACEF